MTSLARHDNGVQLSMRDRIAAFAGKALPIVLLILFFTTAFAKVAASIAHSLSIVLFLIHRWIARTPFAAGRIRTYYGILAAYGVIMLLSLVNTVDIANGLQLIRTTLWKVMIVVVLIETVRSWDDAKRYLFAYAAGCTVLALIGIYQGVVLHVHQPPSMWIAVHGGNLLMFGLIAMLALFVASTRKSEKAVLLLPMLLTAFALYLNGTRGAWVAAAAILMISPLFIPQLSRRSMVAVYATMALAAIIVVQAPYVQLRYREAVNNVRQYQSGQQSTSVGYRFDMWRASLTMFREHPVLGVGQGDWHDELERLVDSGKASPTVRHYRQAHNIFLDALSTQGAAGLAALLAVVFYPLLIVWKSAARYRSFARTLLLCATVAFVISGMTDTLIYIRGVFLSYLMLVGISIAILLPERPTAASSQEH